MKPCKYNGDEPSPKGLGYCAHDEKMYSVKQGLNDFNWIVIPFGKSKKWIPLTIPKDFFNDFKKLDVPVKELKTTINKITRGTWDGSIIVYHSVAPDVVYNNKQFTRAIQKITKQKFMFTEQGMQANKKAHMELDKKSIVNLIKKKYSKFN